MKHLIEFYSKKTLENLISLLKEPYDAITFFYFQDERPNEKTIRLLSKILTKLLGITPDFCSVKKKEIPSILDSFSSLSKDDFLHFDLTGGNELFSVAAGIFYERNRSSSIHLHQYDILTGSLRFALPNPSPVSLPFSYHLTVEQTLLLNGSYLIDSFDPSYSDPILRREVFRLWDAVKDCLRDWNLFVSLTSNFDFHNGIRQEKQFVKASELKSYRIISQRLRNVGILGEETQLQSHGKTFVRYTLFVDKKALFLYQKGGNLLEMIAALSAFDSKMFQEIKVGVVADWDGNPSLPHRPDPRNEIDLFLLFENLPIAASCKNTYLQKEHLYEILIMAKHYGGFYATPVAISSYRASLSLKKRADEMGVILLDALAERSYEDMIRLWKANFRRRHTSLQSSNTVLKQTET